MHVGLRVGSLFGSSTSDTLKAHFGMSIPWWVLSLVVLLIVAVFGHRQVDLSAKVLGIFMLCEVAAILLIGGSIVVHGGASGINLDGFGWDAISSGAPGVAAVRLRVLRRL